MPDPLFDTSNVAISSFTADDWRSVAGLDPRGFVWSPPGQYVIATGSSGRRLAEIRVNYAMDRDHADIADHASRLIKAALYALYVPLYS